LGFFEKSQSLAVYSRLPTGCRQAKMFLQGATNDLHVSVWACYETSAYLTGLLTGHTALNRHCSILGSHLMDTKELQLQLLLFWGLRKLQRDLSNLSAITGLCIGLKLITASALDSMLSSLKVKVKVKGKVTTILCSPSEPWATGPRLWNSLPARLRNPDIIYGLFRWQLKDHLYRCVTSDMQRLINQPMKYIRHTHTS